MAMRSVVRVNLSVDVPVSKGDLGAYSKISKEIGDGVAALAAALHVPASMVSVTNVPQNIRD